MKDNTTKILLIFYLLISVPCTSQASWTLLGETESTSDDVKRSSTGLIYTEKNNDLAWPYDNEPVKGEKVLGASVFQHRVTFANQEFKGIVAELNYGLRVLDNTHIILSAGAHKLETSAPSFDKTKFRPQLTIEHKVSDLLFTSFSYKKDFEYQALTLNLSTVEIIEVDTASLKFLYRAQNIRIPARINYRMFTDGNRRTDADIEAKFPLDQQKNWIWIGAGCYYVTTEKSASYWSPTQFLSFGPRLEFNIGLLQPDLHVFGEIDYNYINEETHYNQGYSLRIGLDKGNRNNTQFKISGFIIDSTQLGQGWKTQGISAEINF